MSKVPDNSLINSALTQHLQVLGTFGSFLFNFKAEVMVATFWMKQSRAREKVHDLCPRSHQVAEQGFETKSHGPSGLPW